MTSPPDFLQSCLHAASTPIIRPFVTSACSTLPDLNVRRTTCAETLSKLAYTKIPVYNFAAGLSTPSSYQIQNDSSMPDVPLLMPTIYHFWDNRYSGNAVRQFGMLGQILQTEKASTKGNNPDDDTPVDNKNALSKSYVHNDYITVPDLYKILFFSIPLHAIN